MVIREKKWKKQIQVNVYGRYVTYNKLELFEPSASQYCGQGGNEYCIEVDQFGNKWNNQCCDWSQNYICQSSNWLISHSTRLNVQKFGYEVLLNIVSLCYGTQDLIKEIIKVNTKTIFSS